MCAPGGGPWCLGEADSFHWPPCFSCSFEELQLSRKILRFHSDPGVEGWAGSDVLWQPCAQALQAGVWDPRVSAGDSADLPRGREDRSRDATACFGPAGKLAGLSAFGRDGSKELAEMPSLGSRCR